MGNEPSGPALVRLLADVGEDTETVPPLQLRDRVLARARESADARPLPGDTDVPKAARPYLRQVRAVLELLPALECAEAGRPVVGGWDAVGVLTHLLAVDALAAAALRLPTPAETGIGRDPARRTAAAQAGPAGASLEAASRTWRRQAAALVRHTAAVGEAGMAASVEYLGLTLSAGDVVLDRAFETWVHAEDLREGSALPAQAPGADDVRLLSDLGMRLLSLEDHDDEPLEGLVTLTGPGGGSWLVGGSGAVPLDAHGPAQPGSVPAGGPAPVRGPGIAPGPALRLDAIDFCRLAGGRARPRAVPHALEGDPAFGRRVLRAAAALARV